MSSSERKPLYKLDTMGDHELVLAAGRGEYETVQQMLRDGANVATRCPLPLGGFNNGRDLVMEDDDPGWLLVSSWLEGSVRVEKANFTRTALQAAAGGGFTDIVELLIDAGADVNAPPAQIFGRTALQAAAGGGHEEAFELLKNFGADINAPPAEQYGRTALQAAAEAGSEYLVNLLIRGGAHVDSPPGERFGRTALQAASGAGCEEVVRILLNYNADVNALPAAVGGRTALQAAAEHGYGNVVAILIEEGADVNASPAANFGITALEGAAGGGYGDVLSQLFEAGVYIGGASGGTILHDAVDDDARLRLLLKLGRFDIDAKDFLGSTPLHIAVKRLKMSAVQLLMSSGADADTADISGQTPLQTALEKGSSEILDILLRNGASTNGLRVDKYLNLLLGVDNIPDDGCAVILREESPQCRRIERSTWHDTEIKDLKDEKWTSPSICLFHSASGIEHFNDTGSFVDPHVYLKAYHGPSHPQGETVVRWSWLTIGDNHNYSSGYPGKFQAGVPNSPGLLSPEPNAEVILVSYVSFTVPAQSYSVVTEMEPFQFIPRKIEISWIMRESDSAPDISREPYQQFGAYERVRGSFMRTGTFNSSKGQPLRSATFNSTKGTFDRGSFLRSVNYRGTLKVKYLTIPRHGVEFFILFLDYIHQNWLEIVQIAKLHLVNIRDAQLRRGGKDPKIIECLLKDSQQWNNFRTDLSHHVLKAEEVLNEFKKNEALYTELVDPDSWQENIGELPPIKDLAKRIRAFEKDCKDKISDLGLETKEMIELEFSLVSIAEARRSIEMSMSMKRLSWITFIFLPLTFCSGLFGMNVNALESYPSWLWYPAFAVPILSSVLVVWIVFKYIPVGEWIEQNIGSRLEAKLSRNKSETTPKSPYRVEDRRGLWGSTRPGRDSTTMKPEANDVSRWRQPYLGTNPTHWGRRISKGRHKDEEHNGMR